MLNLFIMLLLVHGAISASDNFAFMLTKITEQNEVPDIGPRCSFSRCPTIFDIVCSSDLSNVDYIYYGKDAYDHTSFLYSLARRKIMYNGEPLAQVVPREEVYKLTKAFLKAKNVRPRPVSRFVATTHPWSEATVGIFPLWGWCLAALVKCTDCLDYMPTMPECAAYPVGGTICVLGLMCAFSVSSACVHTCNLCDLELVQEQTYE